jgi:hypothetical protein
MIAMKPPEEDKYEVWVFSRTSILGNPRAGM